MTEAHLSNALGDFAPALLTDFPNQRILDQLVRRLVDILPVDAAGVTFISPTSPPHVVVASDPSALRFESLQTELRQGPCLAAYHSERPISVPDLSADKRFPVFAEQALREGLMAVFTFPLRDRDRSIGALDLYRTSAGPLSDSDMEAAQMLADVAAAYLVHAQGRDNLEPLSLSEQGEAGRLTDAQRGLSSAIDRNNDRLNSLVDDLVALSNLGLGAVAADLEDVDLCESVFLAASVLRKPLSGRRLELTLDTPREAVMVRGDPRYLERLVLNLLTNAVKSTADGGWIHCGLEVVEAAARLEVSDNGVGIPATEQHDLFTKFFRSSTSHEHAIQVSELGLSIVRSITHARHGTASATLSPLLGATFVVELPVIQAI